MNLKRMKVCVMSIGSFVFDVFSVEINEIVSEHVESRKATLIRDNMVRTTSFTEQVVISTTTTTVALPISATPTRELWTNKVEFLLSVIGYVVDLGKSIA